MPGVCAFREHYIIQKWRTAIQSGVPPYWGDNSRGEFGIGTDELPSGEAAAASTLGKINLCPGETMNRTRVYVCCAILATGSVAALAAGKGDAAKGKEVFGQCAVCHNADSTDKKMGPGLKGLFKRDKLANGKKITDASVRD